MSVIVDWWVEVAVPRLCSVGSRQCMSGLHNTLLLSPEDVGCDKTAVPLKMLFLTRLKIFVLHVLCSEVLKMFYVVCDKAAAPL